MAGSAASYVTARFLTPDYLVQGRQQTITCPLYQSGALVAPGSASVIIYDAAGAVVVSDGAEIEDDIASFVVLAAVVPSTLPRGMGWRVEWTMTTGSNVRTYRNSAGLIRAELAPVVTDLDLFRRESGLDPAGSAPLSTLATFQPFLDEAWVTILGRLVSKGNLPHLIMEPTALREPHLLLTLHLIFEDFRTRLAEAFGEVEGLQRSL